MEDGSPFVRRAIFWRAFGHEPGRAIRRYLIEIDRRLDGERVQSRMICEPGRLENPLVLQRLFLDCDHGVTIDDKAPAWPVCMERRQVNAIIV